MSPPITFISWSKTVGQGWHIRVEMCSSKQGVASNILSSNTTYHRGHTPTILLRVLHLKKMLHIFEASSVFSFEHFGFLLLSTPPSPKWLHLFLLSGVGSISCGWFLLRFAQIYSPCSSSNVCIMILFLVKSLTFFKTWCRNNSSMNPLLNKPSFPH